MPEKEQDIHCASAPGRICLLGEHQDYIGLPVIPAAIDLRIEISGTARNDNAIHIELPDINSSDEFSINGEVPYVRERDYLRSVVNVVRRRGIPIRSGLDCVVRGKIPINSGTSSSSALCVAWVKFLMDFADAIEFDDPETIARLAHEAEVLEFNEPGGMMDHFATSLGKVNHVQFEPEFKITPINVDLGEFVLGDSLQEKDTVRTLKRIREGVASGIENVKKTLPDFSLGNTSIEMVRDVFLKLPEDERLLLEGSMMTRDIVARTFETLKTGEMSDKELGVLLNLQQNVIREKLRVSTDKLNAMIEASISAGALGGKVNGSGEGGCMFAYAPGCGEMVAEAIEKAGGKAIIIMIGDGVRGSGS